MKRKKKKVKAKIKKLNKRIQVLRKQWSEATQAQDLSETKAQSRKYGKKAKAIDTRLERLDERLMKACRTLRGRK